MRRESWSSTSCGPDGGPIVDEDRFLEIWNLVFMQEELSAVRRKLHAPPELGPTETLTA